MDNLNLESLSLATLLSNMDDDKLKYAFDLLRYQDLIRIDVLLRESKYVFENELYILLRFDCYENEYKICPLLQKFLSEYGYTNRQSATDPVFILSACLLTKNKKFNIVKKINNGEWKLECDHGDHRGWVEPPMNDYITEIEPHNNSNSNGNNNSNNNNLIKILKRPDNLYDQVLGFSEENDIELNIDSVKDFPLTGSYRVKD